MEAESNSECDDVASAMATPEDVVSAVQPEEVVSIFERDVVASALVRPEEATVQAAWRHLQARVWSVAAALTALDSLDLREHGTAVTVASGWELEAVCNSVCDAVPSA